MGTLVSMETGRPVDSSSWECARISEGPGLGPHCALLSSHPPHPTLGPHRHTCSEGRVSAHMPAAARVTPANLALGLDWRSPAPELGTSVGSPG